MLATAKVPNLKANHNVFNRNMTISTAVLATAKVPNLKANHNIDKLVLCDYRAVLATAKVPNLKANHNLFVAFLPQLVGCVSYCESTEFES